MCGRSISDASSLVVLPGSFNPPHTAHLALLDAAARASGASAAAFLISVRTVDKEQPTGMLLEDRLWLMCRLLSDADYALLVANRGLYVDIAAAVRRAAPRLERLTFVVGYDKIVQIFDPRYYQDRDAALRELFAQATFLVAPRDEFTAGDVAALLDRTENATYGSGVATLTLDPALAHVSSTAARESAGATSQAPELASLPDQVRRFLDATGCYAGDDRYAQRGAAIIAAARPPTGQARPA